jgi:hypothetical protein
VVVKRLVSGGIEWIVEVVDGEVAVAGLCLVLEETHLVGVALEMARLFVGERGEVLGRDPSDAAQTLACAGPAIGLGLEYGEQIPTSEREVAWVFGRKLVQADRPEEHWLIGGAGDRALRLALRGGVSTGMFVHVHSSSKDVAVDAANRGGERWGEREGDNKGAKSQQGQSNSNIVVICIFSCLATVAIANYRVLRPQSTFNRLV